MVFLRPPPPSPTPMNDRQPANLSSNLMTNEMSTTDKYETLYFSTLSWRWIGQHLWNTVTELKCPAWLIWKCHDDPEDEKTRHLTVPRTLDKRCAKPNQESTIPIDQATTHTCTKAFIHNSGELKKAFHLKCKKGFEDWTSTNTVVLFFLFLKKKKALRLWDEVQKQETAKHVSECVQKL